MNREDLIDLEDLEKILAFSPLDSSISRYWPLPVCGIGLFPYNVTINLTVRERYCG
jgi:hypothetical protein